MSSENIIIDGVEVHLGHPDELNIRMVGQYELQKQLEACWLTVEEGDLPLVPRLLGRPGVGKTTLAYAAGKKMNQDVYIFQCTMDTRPEDLIITPVLSDSGKGGTSIRYQASSLVTAMIRGGVAILDEANRMTEKSWASLAPLFDNRRYVESITAGVKVKAHEDFRCCVTMNDDSSTFEVPEYIMSRLQPQIYVDFPSQSEEKEILKINLPFAEEELLDMISAFLAHAHQFGEPFSSRDGIHILRYARRISHHQGIPIEDAMKQSIEQVLGKDAVNYLDPDYQPSFNVMNDFWSEEYEEEDDDELV
ncbi:MAG: AAA family ATPase [Spirochaetota bacterium]|nr:AAA family ATPase [Spirochaetota bacterium]